MKPFLLALAVAAVTSGAALAAAPPQVSSTGYDASYPQCSQKLPAAPAFAVVGVNGGIANDENPCLATELAWARSATGVASQPPVSVYVNTGNPGDVKPTVSDWPAAGVNFYGVCTGADTASCAYAYGVQRAQQDLVWIGGASSHIWLDVETANSWSTNQAANAAVLEGMTDTFRASGDTVGLYALASQVSQLIGRYGRSGQVAEGSLIGLPDWAAGATSLAAARAACRDTASFIPGGITAIAQYIVGSAAVDSDYACL